MHVDGSCHCGQVSYRAEIDPEKVSLCNCTDCQMLTGSAFRVSVPASREAFRLLSGQVKAYVKTADSGVKRVHAFCVNCGTPVYSCANVADPPMPQAEGWDETPAELRLPFKILKNAGVMPPEIELFHRRATLRRKLAEVASDEERAALRQRLSELEQFIALRLESMRITGKL